MMNKKYIFLPIGILLTGFLIMVLLINLKSETPKRQQLIQPKIVKSDIVKLKDMVSEIIGLGRLASSQPVTIYSEVTGILEAGTIPFLPAATFKKGDLLFKVDDRQTKLELNSLKSDLMNALASVLPEIKVDFPDPAGPSMAMVVGNPIFFVFLSCFMVKIVHPALNLSEPKR